MQGDKRIQLLNARVDSIIFQYPILTLAQARAATPPSVVKTRGIVTRAWGRFIYIQDATGAIGVRQSSGAMVDSIITNGIRQGDSIEVIGVRADFNNYAQITLSTGAYTTTSSITRLATGRPLPAAQVLTVKQFLASPESFESELVRIVNLRTSSSGAFASSTNYNVWDGSTVGDTTVLRVIASQDSEVDDAPAFNIPSLFTFEGTVIQFCSSPTSGCNTGYQLQGIRKTDIIPQLAPFNLISPANNARIEVAKNSPDAIIINWSASNDTAKYRWKATIPSGNFNIPLLNLPSDINGTDTKLTLTRGAIDAILKSNGLKVGDSITLKWTVYALETTDSLQASQTFNITIARKRILGNFNLIAPANNVTVAIDSNNSTPINISWSASTNATKYKWLAIAAGGNFNNPLLSLNADNNGIANTLSLTSGAVDAVLASNGVKDGDSLSLSWTVRAIEQEDSILANQTFNVKFVRTKNVGLGKYDISNKVNIYPNPTSELINITTTDLIGEGQITLTDLTGRLVLTSNINLDKNQTSVDVSKLNQGIYFLKVVTQQGNATFKVIIQ